MFESLVEFHTPVCESVADAARELRRVPSHAVGAAEAQGLRLGSACTPVQAGCIEDYTRIWWDVRPHPRAG